MTVMVCEFVTYKMVFWDSQQYIPGIEERGGNNASGEILVFPIPAAPLLGLYLAGASAVSMTFSIFMKLETRRAARQE